MGRETSEGSNREEVSTERVREREIILLNRPITAFNGGARGSPSPNIYSERERERERERFY